MGFEGGFCEESFYMLGFSCRQGVRIALFSSYNKVLLLGRVASFSISIIAAFKAAKDSCLLSIDGLGILLENNLTVNIYGVFCEFISRSRLHLR